MCTGLLEYTLCIQTYAFLGCIKLINLKIVSVHTRISYKFPGNYNYFLLAGSKQFSCELLDMVSSASCRFDPKTSVIDLICKIISNLKAVYHFISK